MRRYNADSLIKQISEIQRALVTLVDILSSITIANGMLSLLVDDFFQVQSPAHISIHRRKTLNGFDTSESWQCVAGHHRLALASFQLPFKSFKSLLKCWWLGDPVSPVSVLVIASLIFETLKKKPFLRGWKNGSGVKNTCFCRGPRFGSLNPYTSSQPLETPVLGI